MSAVMQVIQNERGTTGRVVGRIYLYLASLRGTSGWGGGGGAEPHFDNWCVIRGNFCVLVCSRRVADSEHVVFPETLSPRTLSRDLNRRGLKRHART